MFRRRLITAGLPALPLLTLALTIGSTGARPPGQSAQIDVRVPAEATVWFDGEQMREAGAARRFVSPPLDPGRDYTYHIRAQWTEAGQPVQQDRRVTFQAGDHLAVDLTPPGQARFPALDLPSFPDPADPGSPPPHSWTHFFRIRVGCYDTPFYHRRGGPPWAPSGFPAGEG